MWKKKYSMHKTLISMEYEIDGWKTDLPLFFKRLNWEIYSSAKILKVALTLVFLSKFRE